MNAQLEKINEFVARLDSDTQAAFERICAPAKFAKNDFLLRQGDVCRGVYFVEKGIARKFYVTEDGREITTELFFPDDLAVALESYTLQTPSLEFIEALEDTEAVAIDHRKFQELKREFPKLVELDLMITELHAMWLENRLRDFRTLDAAARYRKLCTEQPRLVRSVKLTHIASYLGVSLETLSRIRARI